MSAGGVAALACCGAVSGGWRINIGWLAYSPLKMAGYLVASAALPASSCSAWLAGGVKVSLQPFWPSASAVSWRNAKSWRLCNEATATALQPQRSYSLSMACLSMAKEA